MKEVERVGLLKMDFLGLSTLTLIDDALDGDQAHRRASTLDIDDVPLDDREDLPAVRRTARPTASSSSRARGMRELLRKAKPQRLDDLIALNALYRPGPLQQRHGRRLHRAQAGQDRGQVRAAAARADPRRHLRRHRLPGTGHAHRRGRSPASRSAQSDVLRKAMGKKDPEVMAKQRGSFVDGRAGERRQREEGRRRSST